MKLEVIFVVVCFCEENNIDMKGANEVSNPSHFLGIAPIPIPQNALHCFFPPTFGGVVADLVVFAFMDFVFVVVIGVVVNCFAA